MSDCPDSGSSSSGDPTEASLKVPWDEFYQLIDVAPQERADFLAALAERSPSQAKVLCELLDAHDRTDDLLDKPGSLASGLRGDSSDSSAAQVPFEKLGQFTLSHRIGRGGMGEVYVGSRSVDGTDQRVAVKLLRADSVGEDLRQRFAFERAALARLDHPGIARLIDYGTAPDQRPYLVLEYVEGSPIDVACRERSLGLAARLELFATVCEAVHAAHRSLIGPRDIKPTNILVDDRARLVDFGIAKDLSSGDHTETVQRRLTPSHASPEQLRGDPVTTASDVYSLGVLLCQLVTERLPYRATTTGNTGLDQISLAILNGQSMRPSDLANAASKEESDTGPPPFSAGQLKGDVDAIVARAIALEPERRYASAAALADDVRRSIEGLPIAARPDSLTYRLASAIKRNPLVAASGALATAMLLIALVVMASQRNRLEAALKQADIERSIALDQSSRADLNNRMLQGLLMEASPERARGESVTVLDALARGRERLLDSLAQAPEDRVRLQITILHILTNLARLDEAEEVLEQAFNTLARVSEPGLRVPDAQAHLQLYRGRLTYSRGNVDQALVEFEQAQQTASVALEEQPTPGLRRLSADIQIARATALLASGELSLARDDFQSAIALLQAQEVQQPDDIRALSEGRVGLARVLATEEDWQPALEMQTEALATMVETFGEVEPESLKIRYERALTLERLGATAQATDEYRRVLNGQRRVLGPDHPMAQVTAGRLAAVLQRADRFQESEALYRESISYLAPEAIERTTALINLGWVLHEQGKLAEAGAAYQEADRGLRTLGAPEYMFITPNNNRGLLALDQQDFKSAGLFLGRSLDNAQRLYGDSHSVTAFPLANLARLDLEQGRFREAEQRLRRSLDIRVSALGEGHPDIGHSQLGLARLLCDGALPASTAERRREGLALAEAVFRARKQAGSNYKAALAALEVATCSDALGRPNTRLIEESLPAIVAVRGQDDIVVRRARDRLKGD